MEGISVITLIRCVMTDDLKHKLQRNFWHCDYELLKNYKGIDVVTTF